MNTLKMSVSTFPSTEINLKDDIQLIKVALLYGDKVNLKSIKADLIYRVLDYNKQDKFLDKMLFLRDVAHIAKSDMAQEIESAIYNYRKLVAQATDERKKGLLK